MVDRFVVRARIAKIRDYVALLQKIYKQADEARFIKDPLVYGNAERYLQLAIQRVLAISNHIVADMKLNLPSDNREMFDLLANRKIISRKLADRLTAMAGFRNILVHEYLDIDRRRVYLALKNDLGDFQKFIRATTKLL